MSGFNSNYFNRHLINDMRNALNSVFIGEEQTSARDLEQFRARQDSQRADRIARGQANNAAKNAAKAERETARAAAAARAPEQPSAGFGSQNQSGFGQNLTGTPTAPTAAAGRGARAGQINTDSTKWEQKNGRPLSINQDGSFNISQKTLDQAQANRNSETADSPPRKRYVNPNSPEGRVEASIAAENEPDMQRDRPRDQGGRIVTNARGVQDPDAVGYAAGQRAFDASIASDARASAKAAADARAAADDTEEPEDSIPNNGGLLTQLRGAIRGQNNDRQESGAAKALKDLTDINTQEADARVASSFRGEAQKNQAQIDLRAKEAKQIDNSGEVDRQRNRDYDPQARVASSFKGEDQKNQAQMDLRARERAQTTSTPAAQPAVPAYKPINTSKMKSGERDAANRLNDLFAPAAPAAQTTSTAAASFADTSDGVRQSWGTRPSPNIPQDPNNGRNDINNFNNTPRPRPSNIVDPSADRNLMWNGTIGPNGGQRAKPAGSPKPTLKVENTVKPKTPPQTFFPMR